MNGERSKFNEFFMKRHIMFAYTIASLTGFLFIDIIIRWLFIETHSFSDFLANTFLFIILIMIYYELIIKHLAVNIAIFLKNRPDKVGFLVILAIVILAVIFHYKYNLFEQPIIDFLEQNVPLIKHI